MNALVANIQNLPAQQGSQLKEFVTMTVDGQLLGISVLTVQDVFKHQKITPIPLAPKEIAGSLNLRGRIVTAIDVRARLRLSPRDPKAKVMSVVVEYKGELYSLLVDSVGEVLALPLEKFEKNPANLSQNWQEVSAGIYRLKSDLLVALDVSKLLRVG
ncbi:MAG: chemotaxis protein CheW [Alphaproteobacteria bacterium]|nr:chemotaxis protein CheW [Alphaproteobacteria bacterium]